MDHGDGLEQSRGCARRAVTFLDEHDLPPDPRNFTLAYVYFSGTHPEVRDAFDKLIGHDNLTRESCAHLYEEMFGLDREARAIKSASETIERTLARVLEALSDAGRDAESYGRVLEDFEDRVDAAPDGLGELREAIEAILAETRRMEARSTELESRFVATSEEIVELRKNLDEMRIAATTDALTGVANRKHFDMRLAEFAEDANESGEPLSLVIGDIDHFKTFNDEHGHQVGDMVLRLVARSMAECVRGRDFVARYGGEEFVVVLPKTGLEGALAVAENIRATISSKRLARRKTGETLGLVTLSFGVAQYKKGEPVAALVERADEGLYLAKRRGRNRVDSVEPLAGELRAAAAARG